MAAVPAAADLLESDDDFEYGEVDLMSEEELQDDASEDLDAALRNLLKSQGAVPAAPRGPEAVVEKHPEVVDDFIRNFLVKMGLTRTLEQFETEWYDLKSQGKLLTAAMERVPDAYMHNGTLSDSVLALQQKLAEANSIASKATTTWDSFRKERDFHRMHHKRVVQEKNKLIQDIKRLKEHYAKYEPTIRELRRKYECAMKEKMLTSMDRDKLALKLADSRLSPASSPSAAAAAPGTPKADTIPAVHGSPAKPAPAGGKRPAAKAVPGGAASKAAPPAPPGRTLPAEPRKNPLAGLDFDPINCGALSCAKAFKGHLLGVANLALHPRKPVVATASDDKTWRLWHLPDGDLIMSGEGHKDWVAGIDFHPRGACLASSSGDGTVKIWDFERQSCAATFTEHNAAVWAVAFHDQGDFLASCSLDHSIRLWDLEQGCCRQALRGHVDSINDISWQFASNSLASASSDKTCSVWDCRTGLCCQTFYGHSNSVNSVAFSLQGRTLASCDADGHFKLWDVRMVAELSSVVVSEHPLNRVRFDRSGKIVALACDDGSVYCYDVATHEQAAVLNGHEDAVQALAFDVNGRFLVTASSDCSFILWE